MGKIGIIARFHRTDLVICSHSRGTKPPSYSLINTVTVWYNHGLVEHHTCNFICGTSSHVKVLLHCST